MTAPGAGARGEDAGRTSGRVPPRVLALDGHDGAGKSTLASRLAVRLGAVHLRPFSGPVGERMLRAALDGRYARAAVLARGAVARALAAAPGPLVVCDRHWMTAFTLLPEAYREGWAPLPPTALCYAGVAATRARLAARDGDAGEEGWHRNYIRAYRRLARTFGCEVVRTDRLSEDEALEALAAWAARVLEPAPPPAV